MTRVLLAVEESDVSVAAVQAARGLFGSESDYLAVNVAEEVPSWWTAQPHWGGVYPFPFDAPSPLGEESPEPAGRDPGPDSVARAEATAANVAQQGGVAAVPVAEFGDPAAAIVAAAERHDADVIVVGTHHKGWWRRLFDGSVADAVAKRADRPVLVVSGPAGP